MINSVARVDSQHGSRILLPAAVYTLVGLSIETYGIFMQISRHLPERMPASPFESQFDRSKFGADAHHHPASLLFYEALRGARR